MGGLALVAFAATPALAADTKPPTSPTNNHVTGVTETTVSLAWTKSTDNVGVTEYDVFKQGQQVMKVNGGTLAATVAKLTPGTQYVFTIVARDGAGNSSQDSNEAVATTKPSNDNWPGTTCTRTAARRRSRRPTRPARRSATSPRTPASRSPCGPATWRATSPRRARR
ncbi:MAG: hypothetical protein AUG44_13030 [Actinobacteria bacterium 13_1_20CM_3_71_11]|nr:MAG: hypothetical protein AUG44_13030 [Actinobacteria bacterium 13_1_20CM_3_71_11]